MKILLQYLIIFVVFFVVSYFIYDETSFFKPLLQSVMILILLIVIDLVKDFRNKR